MRELKFRAWDKKRKRYAKHIMTTNTSCPYHDRMNMFKGVMTFAKWILHRYIIEQYTGLKDKNGKEIYEGDIVEVCAMKMSGQIQYDEVYCAYRIVGIGEEALNIHLGNFEWHMLEILGNIHENPELLEAKNVD